MNGPLIGKTATGGPALAQPGHDCDRCPRLVTFRTDNRAAFPDWHNAPVPSFGDLDARMLIVGLAPGLRGANCTGRPFTGDHAGDLLYETLLTAGLARGVYGRTAGDGMRLVDCRVTNAVRCVPPENKPVGAEVKACRPFLVDEIAAMPNLRLVLALGGLAHGAVLDALDLKRLGLKRTEVKFTHGAQHSLPEGLILADSYHCSRYNTSTRRLTPEMFRAVVDAARARLDRA